MSEFSLYIFDFLLTIFDYYLVNIFLQSFLKNISISKRKYQYILLFSVMALYFTNFLDNPLANMTSVLVTTFILSLCYKSDIKSNILVTGFLLIIVIINELIISILMMNIFQLYDINKLINENDYHYLISITVSKITKFLIIILISRFRSFNIGETPKYFSIWLFTVPIISCFVASSTFDTFYNIDPEFFVFRLVGLVGIIYINIIVYIIYEKINYLAQQQLENKLLEQEIKNKDIYYKQIEENQNKLKEIRHNLKNQLIAAKHVLLSSNDPALTSLLSDINLDENIYTENPIVNYIVDSKIGIAKDKHIHIDMKIQIPKELNVKTGDLGIVIGNLLDNAIEANQKLPEEEREIFLAIRYTNKCLMITICNPIPSNKQFKKELFTWKKETEFHGIGLKSIKRIVKLYDGRMEIKVDQRFNVDVILMQV